MHDKQSVCLAYDPNFQRFSLEQWLSVCHGSVRERWRATRVTSTGRTWTVRAQERYRPAMGRVVHFEIHADDVERAVRFYRDVFEWKIETWGGDYWLITTGNAPEPGINGGLMKRRGPRPPEGQPVNAFPCTVEVNDLEASAKKVEASGGKVVVPKMPIPGVGWLTYAHDTEGNVFGMMQSDAAAK